MSYTDDDLKKVYNAIKYFEKLNELNNLESDEIQLGLIVNVAKIKTTCSQCGEVVSEEEFDRIENSQIVQCRQEKMSIDDLCCEECGCELFNIDIEIEISTGEDGEFDE